MLSFHHLEFDQLTVPLTSLSREIVLSEARGSADLTGRVVDRRGRPVAGALVACRGRLTTSEADGSFALAAPNANVRRKTDWIMAVHEGFGVGSVRRGTETGHDLLLVLDRELGAIDGVVVGPNGESVVGAEVWLAKQTWFPRNASRSVESALGKRWLRDPVRTDGEGAFSVSVLADTTYRVFAQDPATGWVAELTCRAGPEEHRLTLSPEVHKSVTGRVLSANGQPLDGASVTVRRVLADVRGATRSAAEIGRKLEETRATEDGTYRFERTPESESWLDVRAEGHVTRRVALPAARTEFDVVLQPAASLSVQLPWPTTGWLEFFDASGEGPIEFRAGTRDKRVLGIAVSNGTEMVVTLPVSARRGVFLEGMSTGLSIETSFSFELSPESPTTVVVPLR